MTTAAELMAFERARLNRPHDGRYERAVRECFDVSVTTHSLRVLAALEDGSAAGADPVTARVLAGWQRRGRERHSA